MFAVQSWITLIFYGQKSLLKTRKIQQGKPQGCEYFSIWDDLGGLKLAAIVKKICEILTYCM